MDYRGYVIATAIKPESREPCAWVYKPRDWRTGKLPLYETTSLDLAMQWVNEQERKALRRKFAEYD